MKNDMILPTEKHPFEPFLPEECQFLIVGSFPPIKLTDKIENNIAKLGAKEMYDAYSISKRNEPSSKDISFYYGSSENLLWDTISSVFQESIDSKNSIKLFLNKHSIAITDVCEKVSRKSTDKGMSSSDSDLVVHEWRDLYDTIQSCKPRLIFSTSKWVTDNIQTQFSKINGIDIITLPSPSPQGSRAIGRQGDYKELRENNEVTDTKDYRIMKYKELLNPILEHTK
ncbi:MAG: hypothetical protein COA58_03295 [Bacteroidetes bacterium]|nr:MAG: hypothetical protein COA58_03295 [Bacteroidota bacterium]